MPTPVPARLTPAQMRLVAVALSVVLTATIGIAAYATRDPRVNEPSHRGATRDPSAVPLGSDYVAIGDSYTAGGPIGLEQKDAGDCQRSADDYPTQVARATRLSLTDVSCVGASTKDLLTGTSSTKAQLASVTKKAKLVTISAGGNDFGIFVSVFLNCIRFAKANLPGSPCRDKLGTLVASQIPRVQQALSEVVATARSRAPTARIMVVSYLRLLPDEGTCTAVPYPEGDVKWVAQVGTNLSAAMGRAATARGVEFVDMYGLSAGHDVCSNVPWTNGLRPKLRDGLFLHPNAAGQDAVAAAVTRAWRKGPPAPQ